MPVTPFHFGVGLLAKGLLGRRVSLSGFCATQVAIDCESGYFLFRGEWPAHRFFHTILGASLLCVATCMVAMPILHRLLLFATRSPDAELAQWLKLHAKPTWVLIFTTALVGMLGHVVPDGIMHSDMRPLAPVSEANPLYEMISVGNLHIALGVVGILGFGLLQVRWARDRAHDR
jgi:hypothetical protein